MTSRDAILTSLRRSRLPDPGLPALDGPWLQVDDLGEAFGAALEAAGGRVQSVAGGSDALDAALRALPGLADARRVVSAIDVLPSRNSGPSPRVPADLATVEWAVLPGRIGVAESGAVWIEPSDAFERAAGFLAPRVALVLARDALVPHLHDAYARIDLGARSFGCFVSGPSKTADIEQALVIGAHGPRALDVLLVGDDGHA